MAGAAAQAPPQGAPQTKEQLQKAVEMNGIRLQHIVDRLRTHFRGGVLPTADLHNLLYAFARGIDYALSGGDIPKMAGQIPDILRKVYQLRNDPFLQSSVMVLIMPCKNACRNKWFQPADFIDILRMADELSDNFCTPGSQPADENTVLEIISTVMPRYYPRLKFDRLVTSLEAKVGYDILVADFFIRRNLPRNEKISLIVVQKENLDASSCITTPQNVSFLVNGKGVDKRTNVSMETGPQFPTDITKMLKYGANILQAVGYFNANYIIAVAVVNNLMSFDAPKLNDYAQSVTTDLRDSDILEGPSRVSLKCPISFGRIKTPIKGHLCKHYQCFDYDNYMEMNLRKPVWRCPCCSTPSNLMDLRIDQKIAKVLQETGDDIIDVLVFPDGSWKAVSVNDEKSDRHAGCIIQQNGDTVETDATHSDVIDLIYGSDDGDLPMSTISASEDVKPLLKSRVLSVSDYLPDLPISTTAQPEDLYVGGGHNGCSNRTSTFGQQLLPSSTGGPGSSSFGTLESILPRNILQVQPVTADAVSPSLETSNSSFAMQQVSQGTHPAQMQSLIDPLLGPEVARPHIPRNVRREPVAVQALGVPLQNPGSSRRVQPNVLNCPPPAPWTQSSSASSNYQPHQVTNADSIIITMNSGVGSLSRAPDAASPLHLQTIQQDMRNTPNHLHGRVIGLAAPPSMGTRPPAGGTGQGRGANAYGAPSPQHQQYDQRLLSDLMSQYSYEGHAFPTHPGSAVSTGIHSHLLAAQHSQASRLQAVSRPATPPMQPRVQSGLQDAVTRASLERGLDLACARLPSAATALRAHSVESSDVQELQVEPNWQPTGQMRGSLTGSAYDRALERYMNPGEQPTSQARPSGTDPRR